MNSESQASSSNGGSVTEEVPTTLPSNQETEEHLRLLHGFLDIPRTSAGSSRNEWDESDAEALLKIEADSLRAKYLEKTDRIDRAADHLEALTRAEAKNRTPAKLRINIQPLVAQRENATFKVNWETAVRQSESNLMKCLQRHLQHIITESNQELEEATTAAFDNLKQTDYSAARTVLKTTLEQANAERLKRNEQRKKRKLEANEKRDEKNSKKSKPNNSNKAD